MLLITLSRVQRARAGIDGAALNWLRSFVTGRSKSVVVGNESAPPTLCTSGVPQIRSVFHVGLSFASQ